MVPGVPQFSLVFSSEEVTARPLPWWPLLLQKPALHAVRVGGDGRMCWNCFAGDTPSPLWFPSGPCLDGVSGALVPNSLLERDF